jgi:phosphoglycolate phosphatase
MKRLARMVMGGERRGPGAGVYAPRVVMFDFDGTIGDTLEAGFEIFNLLAAEFGFRPMGRDEMPRLRDMRTRELMKHAGISAAKLPRISRRGTQELSRRIASIAPLPGVPGLIRELARRGHTLGIITSNSEANVRAFLANHQLENFAFIRSSSKLFGKAREIRAALKGLRAGGHEALFVGDETRDIEACKKAGVPIVAVTWGYNTPAALRAMEPDFLVDSPAEILALAPPPEG